MSGEDQFKTPSAGIELSVNRLRSRQAPLAMYKIRDRWNQSRIKGFGAQNLLRRDGADHPYRIIFERMVQSAVILSVDGTVLDCNPAFASLLRSTLADISGRPFTDWLDQEC